MVSFLLFVLLSSVCWPHFVDTLICLTKGDGNSRFLCQVVSSKFGHIYICPIPHALLKCNVDILPTKGRVWAFLVAQWLRIRLPMQGARVRILVREDPTCRRATKPMCDNY